MKKYVGIGLAVLVLAVLAAVLWYSRPLTIEELCPGIHLDACTAVSFDYSTFETQEMADCTQSLRLEVGPPSPAGAPSRTEVPPVAHLLAYRGRKNAPVAGRGLPLVSVPGL